MMWTFYYIKVFIETIINASPMGMNILNTSSEIQAIWVKKLIMDKIGW
jgi:hypothetical protein